MDRTEFAKQVGQLAQRWVEGPPVPWSDPASQRWVGAFLDAAEKLARVSVPGYIVHGAQVPVLAQLISGALACRHSDPLAEEVAHARAFAQGADEPEVVRARAADRAELLVREYAAQVGRVPTREETCRQATDAAEWAAENTMQGVL